MECCTDSNKAIHIHCKILQNFISLCYGMVHNLSKWFPAFLDIPLLPLHLMQVREYFVTQRSHLRNLVQKCSDVGERNLVTNAEVQLQQPPSTATAESNIGFTKLTDGESVDMLLELMRSERTFKGQGQLLQVILQTEPGLILRRFLEKGGLKIVYRWLIQASSDNQSSLLQILLEV
jgi:hypothetical protein